MPRDRARDSRAIADRATANPAIADQAVAGQAIAGQAIADQAIANAATDDRAIDDRLDPVRLRPPRARGLLRATGVAVLLALAAGVLWIDADDPPACRGAAASPTASSAPPTPTGRGANTSAPLPVPDGHLGIPVQVAEPATLAVVRPGDRVDLIARTGDPTAAAGDTEPATVLARDVLVLAVGPDPQASLDEGVVYLAMTADEAERVATASPEVPIGVMVRPPRPGD